MTQNSTVYCWFDWDDDTTSVNNLNIVKEPRKRWNEYFPGEEITANLPKYGLWKGVIVETSESKKDLEKKMKDRQQLQAEMVECETSQCKTDKADKRKRKEDKTKNCTANDNERIEEKRRKKELDRNKLEAVNKQLEQIVQRRRLAISDSDSHPYRDERNQNAGEISNTLSTDTSMSDQCNVNTELGKRTRFDLIAYADRDLYATNTAFQPYIPPQNYSFLEDLYRSPGTSYQTLQTPQKQLNDVHLKNQALEEENRQLKEEVSRLKEEVTMLKSSATMLPGIPATTPTKITFLKQLTSALEDKRSFGMRANNEIVLHTDVQSPIRPKPVRLLFSQTEHQAENTNKTNQHCDKQYSCEESVPLNTWEEPHTSSGNPKIKLVADYDVYLTQAQLSQANHRANGNPRKLIITLLDTFFTRDKLAESSALGAKSAHNKKDDKASVPLPSIVLASLKLYVLRLHKRPNGEPCLTDAAFNDIINQKCATARRSLKTLKEKKQAEEYEKNRKKQEEEEKLKQPKEIVRHNSMPLSVEASTSEDSGHDQRQSSRDDLDMITMRPPVNKDGIMKKQSIRINLRKLKKKIQEQSNERPQMAEQLKFSNKNRNAAMFIDDSSSSTVSFGSYFKRKSNDNGRPSKIFIEDDATVTFVQNNAEDDNVLDLSNLQEMDEDEEQSINHNISQQDVKPSLEKLTHNISQQDVKPCMEELEHNISQQDVKPSIEELNRAIILPQLNVERLEKAIKKSKPVVEFVHQTVQTVPVVIGLATQDDVDLGKLSPLEKNQHLVAQRKKVCELQKKLEDTNSRFKSLQVNICNLLKLIDPDFDCGQPDNIENVILDFIRVRSDAESE